MWVVGVYPGMDRWMGRTEGEDVGRTVTYGEREDCHRTMVPPQALLEERGRSGQ